MLPAASGKDILVAVHYTNIDDMKKLDTLLTGSAGKRNRL